MKKFLQLFALVALLAVPWATQAQSTLTTCNGTATHQYVPFYGYYADESQNGQMIYPADSLTDMIGMQINQMVFYVSSYGSYGGDIGNWVVSLGTTTESTLSGINSTVTLSEVYSGAMTFNSDNTQMIVSFDNGFVYNGGNLLVQFNHPISAGYRQIYFYGVAASGASYTYNSQRDFLPKVTFSYGTPSNCSKPSFATVDSVGPYNAYLRWATGSGATAYDLFYGTANDIATANVESSITDTTYTLTGLLPQTTYYAWVRTACGYDSADARYIGSFTTQMTCAPVTSAVLGNVSYTAAIINWGYNTSVGFPTEGVQLTLIDNTDTNAAPVVVEVTGTSYTFSDLISAHSYTVILRNFCQAESSVDTAANVTVNFMTQSCSEISSDGSTNNLIPSYVYYGNSYSQFIYLASEMPDIDTIHGIAFNITSPNTGNNEARTFDVYIANTDSSAFNGSNFMTVESTMLVASDKIFHSNQAGWQAIAFDNDFVYDNTKNLFVVINDKTGAYGSAAYYASINASGRAVSTYRDGATSQYDPFTTTSGSSRNAIPAIRFIASCEVPTCFAPMLNDITDIDSNAITVTWVSVGSESSWVVGCTANAESAIVWNTTTDTAYTFNNLAANTAYTFYIGSICGDDTLWASANARTACGAMAFPFSDNFDSYDNGFFPPCWHRVKAHGTDPSVNAQYHASGTQSMFLLAINDTNLFVTPGTIPTAGNNIYVRYNAFLNWSSYYSGTKWIKAGVMTDINDVSTFIALDSIGYHNFNDVFEEREFNTATLDPTATYWVAWMFYSENIGYGSYNRGAVDDVYISEIPSCLHVDNVVVDTVTSDGATLHWTATPDQHNFYVRVGNTVYDATDTTYTITGLNARTAYTAYVAANCSGDSSEWMSVDFVTGCASGECEIVLVSTNDYLSYGTYYISYSPELKVVQNGAEIATVQGTTDTVSVCTGMPVAVIFNGGDIYSYANPSATIIDGGDEEVFNGAVASYTVGDTLAYMANACPSCLKPSGLTPIVVDSNQITFTWSVEGGTTYLVSFDGGAYTSNTTGVYTAYGLNPNTQHTFAVKAICGVGDTSNPRVVTLKTACGEMAIPYVENFEGDAYNEVPSCWTVVSAGANNFPAIDDNGHNGSAKSLTFVSNSTNTAMIASSRIPLPGDSIKVSFWAFKDYGYGTLEAGMMTNPYVDSTFTSLVTVTASEYTLYEFNTNTLNHDSTYYLAFRYAYNYDYYWAKVDDINISLDEGCMTPADVTATPDSTVPSITVTWTSAGTINDFVVEYREVGSTDWSDPLYTGAHNKTITGLNYSSAYEIRVGQLCGSDTLWSTTVSASTVCGLVTLPYEENFVSATGSLPPCWNYTTPSYFHWNRWTTHAETSGDGEMMAGSGSAGEAAILPTFNASLVKLQISYKAKLGNISEGDGMMMGAYNETTGTVEWLDTLTNPSQCRENFVVFTYNYLNYTGSGTRIAIGHSHNNSGDWGFALDSIVVVELANCNPPENIEVHNTMYPNTADDVYFTWTVSSTGTGVPTQWQLYIDTITSTDIIDSIPESQLITVDTSYYMPPINTLAEGAHYRFFVRSICNAIDRSDWVELQNGFSTDEYWMNNTGVADTIVGCDFIIYDNGGPVAGYLHNSNSALVIQAGEVGRELQLQGAFFSHGADANTFTVYDGIGTTGMVLYTRNNTNMTETIDSVLATSTTGAMTITFTSGYYAALGYELYIHCVGAATCTKPTNLQVEMTSHTTAYATWDSTGAAYYRVYHRIAGDSVWNMNPTYTNSITLNGLPVDVNYDFYVVAYCSDNDFSAASIIRHFNTHWELPCFVPENLQASDVDQHNATISWTGTGTMWEVALVGGATVTTTNNSYTFSGLTSNTAYSVLVRSVCDATDSIYSDWSDTLFFTTQPMTYTITVATNNSDWGTATGGGLYVEGTTATLVAVPSEGYHFVKWHEDDVTTASRNVVVTADATYTAIFGPDDVGIENVEDGNVTLFPNPASTMVTINGIEGESTVTVVDLNGREVFNTTANETLTIDLTGYAKGAYFVRITGERTTAIRKLIVK